MGWHDGTIITQVASEVVQRSPNDLEQISRKDAKSAKIHHTDSFAPLGEPFQFSTYFASAIPG